jgi:hypothetical protein
MKFYDSKPSFASGEVSPLLAAREDLAAYMIGAKELTNFLVLPQGGIINRPGTKKLGGGAAMNAARLVPFVYSESDSYCLVFKSNSTVDVYDSSGFRRSIPNSPYDASHLSGLRWLQSANVLYLFHHNVPVYMLKRYASPVETWAFEQVEFKSGPYQDMNSDGNKKMRLYGLVLSSDWDFFSSNMLGVFVKFEFKVKASADDFILESIGEGDPAWSGEFMLFGPSTIQSNGLWWGKVEIWRKLPDDDDFTMLKAYPAEGNYNLGYTVSEENYGTMYKIRFVGDDDGGNKEKINISWSSGGGLAIRQVKIASYNNPRMVNVVSADDVRTNINWTEDWAIGAFGAKFGYPLLGIFHQERLILANTPNDPQTLWMSQPANWHDFGTSIPSEDTDSITVTLAAKEINEIRGLASRSDLLILTGGAEWVAKAGSKSDVFTPSSITLTPSSYRGSADIAPLDVGTSTLFVQKHGRVVRGLGYQLDIDGYSASDLSILSEHLFENTKVVRWAYQQEPWSIVWIVLQSGAALALTVQQEHQVTAWTRHAFNGSVLDVCSIPGLTQDDVFMLVSGSGGTTNLVMLNERKDDASFSPEIYRDEGTHAFISRFESLELVQNLGGSLQGRHKHIPGIAARLFRTCGFKAGIITENSDLVDQVTFPDQLSPSNRAIPYTGDIYIRVPGGTARSCRLRVENDAPQPVTILGVFQEVGIHESSE